MIRESAGIPDVSQQRRTGAYLANGGDRIAASPAASGLDGEEQETGPDYRFAEPGGRTGH